jgi:MFS transporter, FSR family, fosmidomycin resistance protein
MRADLDRRSMAALSGGHMAVDFAAGTLLALLPYLKDRFGLSYTLTAVLLLSSTVASSIVQPLFGLWSDRRGALWLLPVGVAVAGVGMGLAADAPAYWLVVVCVVVSGLGVAAYHPEGSKFAAYASGLRRATGMSLFSIGGNVGYGLGPFLAGFVLTSLGLRGGLLLMIPCLAVAAAILALRPRLASLAPEHGTHPGGAGENRPRALALLLVVVAARSVAWFGLITFVPFWEEHLGNGKVHGNHLLSLMLLTGGIGTIAQGQLADAVGRRFTMLLSLVLVPPLTLVYMLVGGVPGAVALALIGICVIGTFGVTMVMAQEYLPGNIGMASGLSIGFSIGLGGIGAVALGAVADSVDLRAALYASIGAAVVAVACGAFLPATGAEARRPMRYPRLRLLQTKEGTRG